LDQKEVLIATFGQGRANDWQVLDLYLNVFRAIHGEHGDLHPGKCWIRVIADEEAESGLQQLWDFGLNKEARQLVADLLGQ